MKRYTAHLSVFFVLLVTTPAFALPYVTVPAIADNDDGSRTFWLEVYTLPEVSFLEFWITPFGDGTLGQVQDSSVLYAAFGPDWAPNVIFTSDASLAGAFDPEYAANAHLDTVVDNSNWAGIVIADLVPDEGTPDDGSQMVHVALTSFTGPGQGGPLPGGFIPLVQVTFRGPGFMVSGSLQSESDQDGSFDFWYVMPEPSTGCLVIVGALTICTLPKRRRRLPIG